MDLETLTRQSWFRHGMLVFAMILVTICMALAFRRGAHKDCNQFFAPLVKSEGIIDSLLEIKAQENPELKILQELNSIISQKKEHRKTVVITLYKYHFTSVTMLLILSTISIVVVFIIAQKGINNAGSYMKTVFFTLAALTTFYALSPPVYQQDTLIDINADAYVHLDNLQMKVLECASVKSTAECQTFYHQIVDSMELYNSVNIRFDVSKIKTPNFFEKR